MTSELGNVCVCETEREKDSTVDPFTQEVNREITYKQTQLTNYILSKVFRPHLNSRDDLHPAVKKTHQKVVFKGN